MSIIDNTLPEYEDLPDSLNGEVLLERPAVGGFITCTVEAAHWLKQASSAQKAAKGYGPFETIIDDSDTTGAVLPTVAEYKLELLAQTDTMLFDTRLKSWSNVLLIFAECKAYQGAGFPADLEGYQLVEAESDYTNRSPQQAALHFATSIPKLRAKLAAMGQAGNITAAMAISHDWYDDINDLLDLG